MFCYHMLGSFDPAVYCTLCILSKVNDGEVNCKISCQKIKWFMEKVVF